MMLHINLWFAFVIALIACSGVAAAGTDPKCLQHLGGGFSDTECYQGLSNDLVSNNKRLYNKIQATIPAGNSHAKLLADYMTAQDELVKYCDIQRNAGAKWQMEHDGSMFPAIYAQCVYELRKRQYQFLKNTLEMANWN